jgi:hypothetical protein
MQLIFLSPRILLHYLQKYNFLKKHVNGDNPTEVSESNKFKTFTIERTWAKYDREDKLGEISDFERIVVDCW